MGREWSVFVEESVERESGEGVECVWFYRESGEIVGRESWEKVEFKVSELGESGV